MTTVYLNDREASYIDFKELDWKGIKGWLDGITPDGSAIHIPVSSILYVEEGESNEDER